MKKRLLFFFTFATSALVLLSLTLFVSPAQASQVKEEPIFTAETLLTKGLTPIAILQPDADFTEVMDTWSTEKEELTVTANSEGITLVNCTTGKSLDFPLPQAGGPGRDILPWVVIPQQIAFSPDGQWLMLLTMEGYPDQGADYFRLWVLNLDGQVEASTHGNGIHQAAWINPENIIFFDYEDPSLRNGTVWLWEWKS